MHVQIKRNPAQACTKRLSVLGFLRDAANPFMAGHEL